MIIKEEWRPLIYGDTDLSNKYEISNLGHMRRTVSHEIIKQCKSKTGYMTICISHGKKKRQCLKIHRAVAYAFLPNPDNLPAVNHIDGDKSNNRVDNLEWCSNKQNIEHAIKNGLFHNGAEKRRKRIISLEDKRLFESITEAAKYIHSQRDTTKLKSIDDTIRKALKHKRKAYDRTWIYADHQEEGNT